MSTLYVTEPGARIEKEYGRLLVTKDDEVLLAAPLVHVSEVVLMSGVGVTTPALLMLLDQGVGLSLISNGGRLRGRLIAAEARNLPLRHKQYACASNEQFCLEVSRAIVAGKLRNCRTLARQMLRGQARGAALTEGPADADRVEEEPQRVELRLRPTAQATIERITRALAQVPTARSLAELRGLEGSGSQAYFMILKATLRAELTFERRSRRPPKDPANALLSLAYTLLTNAVFTACEVAGLDAYDGFFHVDKYGRPALALDLVEEFRSIVADSVVLTVVNNRMIGPDDFTEADNGGTYLARRALRKFVAQFGRRLATTVYHPDAERALSYQKVFEVQARRLRKCIESGTPQYAPFLAK
ncbi:CRISPR-associated endonuclease Cas1 [Anaerolineae bacterium]|nr:CRISPR-associated endonuclease Cas1 [Anaerolineae bacterium]